MKRAIVACAVVALAVAVAGCGGGGGSSLSAEDYGKQLNQICADYNAKVKEIGEPQDIAGLADKGPQLLDEFNKAIDKAKALDPPEALQPTVDQFISKSEALVATIEQVIDAAKQNAAAKIQEIGAKADELSATTDQLGKDLGAPACAEG